MAFDFKNIVEKAVGGKDIDVKALIEKAVDVLQNDDKLLESFKDNPVKVVEKILNVDLPDEILEKIVDAVKAKISIDDAKEVIGKLSGLFGKK